MRVLVDMQGAQNDSRFRGIGRYTNDFVKALIAEKSDSDEVCLLVNGCLEDGARAVRATFAGLIPDEGFVEWFPVTPVDWARHSNLVRRKTAEAIREWTASQVSPDVLIVSSLVEGCGDNVVSSVSLHFPMVTAAIFYDLIPFHYPDKYLVNESLRGWYSEKLDHFRRSDLLMAISEASKDDAVTHLGVPSEKVVTISSGIQAEHFTKTAAVWADVAKKYGVNAPFLLYVGAADPRKNIGAFLQAFARLPERLLGELSIVLVGQVSKQQKKILQGHVKSCPRGTKQLLFADYVSDDELVAFYQQAIALVFPSYHEGFGLPLLEAIAAGCPVIASNRSSLPEVLSCGDALFDPDSIPSMSRLIERVVMDSDFRQYLLNCERPRVAHFSWNKVAQRAWNALRSLQPVTRPVTPDRKDLIAEIGAIMGDLGAVLDDYQLVANAIDLTVASSALGPQVSKCDNSKLA